MTTFRRTPILVHLVGAALASALAAFWILRLAAPAATVAPAMPSAPAPRDPDARLAARMFGDVNGAPVAVAANMQVSGVFAAGRDSSAVIAVDGKAARAVLLGNDVVPGTRLVEVRPDGVTLERDGAQSQYAVPPPSIAKPSAAAAMFRRDGNTLTAPSQEVPVATTGSSIPGRPTAPPANLAPPVPRRNGDEPPAPGRMMQPPPGVPSAIPPAPANLSGG